MSSGLQGTTAKELLWCDSLITLLLWWGLAHSIAKLRRFRLVVRKLVCIPLATELWHWQNVVLWCSAAHQLHTGACRAPVKVETRPGLLWYW